MSEPTEFRLYEVYASVQGEKYKENYLFCVACSNAQKAVELVMKKQPKADIWQINHRGHFGRNCILIEGLDL